MKLFARRLSSLQQTSVPSVFPQETGAALVAVKKRQLQVVEEKYRELERMAEHNAHRSLEFVPSQMIKGSQYFVSQKGNQKRNGLQLVH